jgi:outer membrane protein assembly factor BamB
MFIGNSSDSAPFVEGIVALKVQPDCSLALAWQNSVSDPGPWASVSPPTVANGVVYYGNGVGNKEFAFDAATGTKLWDSGATIGGPIYAAPTVVNGMVFVGSWDHVLHAYGV